MFHIKTPWPASNRPQARGRRRGANRSIFAAPPLGGAGVLNPLSESQKLKLRGAPPPAAGPCPKCSKIDEFSDLNKYEETTHKLVPKGSLGAPKHHKKSEKSSKVPVDVSFWMVLGKSLAARASQEAQRTKTGDEKANPITPARSKHSLHFSSKT